MSSYMASSRNLKSLGVLAVVAAFQFGCTPAPEKARVSISLPSSSALSAGSGKTMTALADDDESHWGLSTPTSLAQIKCFVVFVGGSEPELSKHQCLDSSKSRPFRFGAKAGLIPAGGKATLEVPAGPARTITVAGLALADGASCEQLNENGDLNPSLYSNPVIIAQGVKDMTPGDNFISLKAELSDYKLGDCDFGNKDKESGPGLFLGSGADGDITISGAVDLTTIQNASGTRKLTTVTRIQGVTAESTDSKTFVVNTANTSLDSQNFDAGDEAVMYILGSSHNGGDCGQLHTGFVVPGRIKSAPYLEGTGKSIRVSFSDSRVGTLDNSALAAPALAGGETFCRAVLVRVPNINNLTLSPYEDGSGSIQVSNGLGTLGALDQTGGLLFMRVRGTLSVMDAYAFDVSGMGYLGGMSGGYPGEGHTGYMDSTSSNGTGSSGGGSVSYGGAAGGSHGGSGLEGTDGSSVIAFPGYTVGDQYGCGYENPDPDQKCLFGKMFLGGAGGGSSTGAGGSGGGLISIAVNNLKVQSTAQLTLMASGDSVASSNQGAGAGGSILLRALNIDVTGSFSLNAKGGSAGDNTTSKGGAGGGGRVHIDVQNSCSTSLGTVATWVEGGISGATPMVLRYAEPGTSLLTGKAAQSATCSLGL